MGIAGRYNDGACGTRHEIRQSVPTRRWYHRACTVWGLGTHRNTRVVGPRVLGRGKEADSTVQYVSQTTVPDHVSLTLTV